MNNLQIDSRSVFRVVLIAILAVAVAALAREVLSEIQQTLRWLAAAIFLALALAPAVSLVQRARVRGHNPPRWLAIAIVFVASLGAFVFLVLNVIPPMITEVEEIGKKGPGYVTDLENWAEGSAAFQDLNEKFNLTETLKTQTAKIPSELGDAASELEDVSVGVLKNLVSAVTIIVLAFFLLLEGPGMVDRFLSWLGGERERRGRRMVEGVYSVVRGYVTINVTLAVAAGLFTWGILEILGVDLAVPLAILMAVFDLIPLIGLTIGGLVVAAVAALHSFPDALIIWLVAFLIYQQVQDRVVQPMLYGRAVKVNPLIAVVALLAGAQILGILGALLAIPVAASIVVIIQTLRGDPGTAAMLEPPPPAAGPERGSGHQPAPAAGG